MTKEKTEIVLFETKDKSVSLPVEVKDETVWLNVSQMAILFDREESNIRRHVLNVFKEKEVEENNNVQKIHVNYRLCSFKLKQMKNQSQKFTIDF